MRPGAAPPLEPGKGAAERGSLAGAVNVAMGGEDLLGQRRAGARHADDENGGAVGVAGLRPVGEPIPGEVCNRGVDEGAVLRPRERLKAGQRRMAGLPLGEGARMPALARPELGEVEMGHDRMFRDALRPHLIEALLDKSGLALGLTRVPFHRGEQDATPVRQRRLRWGRRARLGKRVEGLAGFLRAPQLKQGEGLLQPPVPVGRGVCRLVRFVQERERVGRALLLQEVGGEVEPRADRLRFGGDALAHQFFGRLGFAADPHEGGQVGEGRRVPGVGLQGEAHRRLGVLDRALAVAREAEIDIGVGPARRELDGGPEGLFRAFGLAEGEISLAVGVVGGRKPRRAVAGLARGDQRLLVAAERQQRHRGVQERRRVVGETPLRGGQRSDGLGVPAQRLQRDAELELQSCIAGIAFQRRRKHVDRLDVTVGAQQFAGAVAQGGEGLRGGVLNRGQDVLRSPSRRSKSRLGDLSRETAPGKAGTPRGNPARAKSCR